MSQENFDITADTDLPDEDRYYLSDEDIKDVVDAIDQQDSDTVHSVLDELSASDKAELLGKISDEERSELLSSYGHTIDPVVFTEMDNVLQSQTLSSMPAKSVATIISALESDDALEIIQNLDEDFQREVIRKLSAKMRLTVEEGLTFPEDSAGRMMQREVVAVPQFWTVGKTIDYLREAAEDLPFDFFDIFVINPSYKIVGEIPLNKLVRAKRSEKIENLALDDIFHIPATMDQEEVAHVFRRDNITSAPVVDEEDRLIGVITIDDVVDVIDQEAQEDLLKMAGVDEGDLYKAVWSTTGTRFRWLFVNLLTAILASIVISFFDATIEQIVALAVLMPIVASMGGNAGTQTLTVAVRALASRQLSDTNTLRIIWKETLVGSINGVAFAVIMGLLTAFWFENQILGFVIALAMIVNLFVAGFFGATIPILLNRLGNDPAVSSTVLLTTITDVVGFFVFLSLAAILLL